MYIKNITQLMHAIGTIMENFFKDFIYLLLERGEGRRKSGRETSMCDCLSHAPRGDLALNPGMCPDWESNQQPFSSQASAQSTEPHQPRNYGEY